MDQIQLYSEKVRRTTLRVRIRSNYHLKRLGLRMLRSYLRQRHVKQYNNQKAIELRHKFDQKKKSKVIRFIQRLNDFEKQWMENVRFEIYWADKFQ